MTTTVSCQSTGPTIEHTGCPLSRSGPGDALARPAFDGALPLTRYERLVLAAGLQIACLIIWAVERAPRRHPLR
ncbi:MAG TPA: hypothetical protein VLL25_05850 [Acidimicrobiales bacterium]|nr:hypothetical protein [Acidimicrobiales bacterium]